MLIWLFQNGTKEKSIVEKFCSRKAQGLVQVLSSPCCRTGFAVVDYTVPGHQTGSARKIERIVRARDNRNAIELHDNI